MKKIIFGLLLGLFLTGCQQPTFDNYSVPEVELEQEIFQDEHKVIIEEYRVIFNEYKADLESKKEVFEIEVKAEAGTFDNIIECLNWYIEDNWNRRVEENIKYGGDALFIYEGDITPSRVLYKKYVEIGRKDLAEVEAQYAEINSLLEEVNKILDELDSMYVERIVVSKIELGNEIESLELIDIQALVKKCGDVYDSIWDLPFVGYEK